jgi:hypothetical protein
MIEIDENMNQHDVDDLLEELLEQAMEVGIWLSLDFGDKLALKVEAQGCIKEDLITKKKSIDIVCIKNRVDEMMLKVASKKEELEKQQEKKLFQKI